MSEAFLKLVNMSISAGWLVLAVLAFRLILKKAPKWVNVLLWGIVALRLICPFSIESALSLIPSQETISPEIMMDWTPEISTGIEPFDQVVNPVISTSFAPEPLSSANPLQILIPMAANIWLLGVIAMLAYTVFSYLSLRRSLRTAVILRGNIFQCETVQSPFVLGILKPRIYLPYAIEGQNLHHMVAHEQAHIRRLDHWWKPLGFLLLTVYWFNPLMWVAYVLLCRDIELACDEKVIAELGNDQRADYTQALVACSVNHRRIAACPLAFGEVGVKERVKSIMYYRKPAFWVVLVSVIGCIVIAVCFLTNPKKDNFTLRIVVPAGSQEAFVYADEEISPLGKYIKIASGDGLVDTEVLLKTVQVKTETSYEPAYLTPGMPVKMEAERGGWFKIGVNMQNNTNEDKIVYVNVENIEVRISDSHAPAKAEFEAKILEIQDGYFLVEPVEGSWELNSADKIEIPMKNMSPSLEPQIGDILQIAYDGLIQETYPARITGVYSIRVAESNSEIYNYPPALMVTYREETIEDPRIGLINWECTKEDGTKETVLGDGAHPLDAKHSSPFLTLDPYVDEPFEIRLQWDLMPDSVLVRYWGEESWGKLESEPAGRILVNDNNKTGDAFCFEPIEENCIYEVLATWDKDPNYSGKVYYNFHAVMTDKVPSDQELYEKYISDSPKGKCSYVDVDDDGKQELFISRNNGESELVTVTDGKIVRILYEYHLFLCEDGIIGRKGEGSGGQTLMYYKIENQEPVIVDVITNLNDDTWYHTSDVTDIRYVSYKTMNRITEEEAHKICAQYVLLEDTMPFSLSNFYPQ